MKQIIVALVFISLLAAMATEAGATEKYSAASKLGRGVANFFTGWVEIPIEVGKTIQKRGELAAFFAAPFSGLVKAVARTAVGLYEVITFPFPLPAEYKPIIEPEFVVEKDD